MKNLKQSILEKLIITKDTKEKINIDDICEYLSNLFKKYGFEKIEDLDNYMMLPLKVKKEDKEGE